jgi:hypothetical protein
MIKLKAQSKTDKTKYYLVTMDDNGVSTCECMYFQKRGHKIGLGTCEHIKRAEKYYQAKLQKFYERPRENV